MHQLKITFQLFFLFIFIAISAQEILVIEIDFDSNSNQESIEITFHSSKSEALAFLKRYNSTNGFDRIITWDFTQSIHNWYGLIVNANVCFICLGLDGNTKFNQVNQDDGGYVLMGIMPDINLVKLEFLSLA